MSEYEFQIKFLKIMESFGGSTQNSRVILLFNQSYLGRDVSLSKKNGKI